MLLRLLATIENYTNQILGNERRKVVALLIVKLMKKQQAGGQICEIILLSLPRVHKYPMEKECKELPEDCWELITSRLGDYREWESLSLVCKKLLSITNRLRVTLVVFNPSIEVLRKQLRRFQHVIEINLNYFGGPLDEALLEIAQSGVNLKELYISYKSNLPMIPKGFGFKMKNIKTLSLSDSDLTDRGLVGLAESLPSIEKLDLQFCRGITDEGIAAMSTKLKHLRTIDLTHNTEVSDQSIISLTSNCESLTEIVLLDTTVSQAGISYLMRNSHNYTSFILSPVQWFLLELPNLHNFSTCISTIYLSNMRCSDKLLNEIVRADLPLKKFHLLDCYTFTLDGLYSLLKAYPSLESLSLGDVEDINDAFVRRTCEFITKLHSIKLERCYDLTCSSLIDIASACPRITNIILEIGKHGVNRTTGSAKFSSITSAHVNRYALEEVLHFCPNLRFLTVTVGDYSHHKDVDIAFILKSCRNIRHLRVVSCQRLKFTGEGDEEICNLESLDVTHSGIDDKVLKMVGKRCAQLLYLSLDYCERVTERGVRDVMKQMRRLKCINLKGCVSVNKDVVSWMVASCPSLRRIVTPRAMDHSIGELDNFLRQGCVVIPGTWLMNWGENFGP